MNQFRLFLESEGDAWFERNAQTLSTDRLADSDPVVRLLEQHRIRPNRALEIGASNGYRLATLQQLYNCACTGLEPSARAIQDGQRRFPEIRFLRGLSHDLGHLEDGQFDLVIIHFVLHWVDRNLLMRTAVEIDRVLQDGGHLIVGDFWPDAPTRVAYHHLPGQDVWTYKQDYPNLWLATELYRSKGRLTFDHAGRADPSDPSYSSRCQVALLQKDLQGRYRPALLPAQGEPAGKTQHTPFLQGTRLHLREMRLSDVGTHYYRWMNDPAVTRFLESRYFPNGMDELRRFVERYQADPNTIFLAIVLNEGDRHIGNIKLGPIEWIHRRAEVGFLLGEKDCWGRGFASEAIALVADYAFGRLNLHKLTAGCYAANLGSVRAMEKAGFIREGLRKQSCFYEGAYDDLILMGRLGPA